MTTQQILAKCRETDDQSTVRFFVCGNDETLLDGTYLHHVNGDVGDAVRIACLMIDDGDGRADSKVESFFRDWHGGRFDQFYKRHGFVAVATDAPQWAHDLAERADEAMGAEIARLDLDAETADRLFWADELENEDNESALADCKFVVEQLLLTEASVDYHTRGSIAAALRANDASLLVARDD